jgi:hypothetical protein
MNRTDTHFAEYSNDGQTWTQEKGRRWGRMVKVFRSEAGANNAAGLMRRHGLQARATRRPA